MKNLSIGELTLGSLKLAYGCWRIAGDGDPAAVKKGEDAVIHAFENGFTLFDLADIYAGGQSETIFGRVLQKVPEIRNEGIIATKCGIRLPGDPEPTSPFRYDFSSQHIINACEASLRRLGIDCIDLYQLHRPDFLMNPPEVAAAFSQLKDSGKVKEFGLSNFRASQLTALQSACPFKLVVNQIEISLANQTALDDGTLDQCLAENIIPMAWSPLAGGKLADGAQNILPSQEKYQPEPYLPTIDKIAHNHATTRSVIALAWLLKHPAKIIPIIGSTNRERISQLATAEEVLLSREEWYELLQAARGERLP